MSYNSWGNYPSLKSSKVSLIEWHGQHIDFDQQEKSFLCYAQGRSYGDSCLNENGILLDTRRMNRFLFFDEKLGVLRCEAGITFDEILKFIIPKGWFLPVVPGTRFISLGGAIANDIHGKNHHKAGTFGCYVRCFELLRSTGERLFCSSESNPGFYKATIAGLGLTGLITWAEIQLIPIQSHCLDVEYIKFESLSEFFSINKASEESFLYTVAWLDCVHDRNAFGRGIFMRANHASQGMKSVSSSRSMTIPFYFPSVILNRYFVKVFNSTFYKKYKKQSIKKVDCYSYFFQLDAIRHWNRIYGRRGFLQYQCVLPENCEILSEFLSKIVKSAQGSFLSVLKTFGDLVSPGVLSFPKKGVTLALDFSNQGSKTLELFNQLDEIVVANNGRIYPAKDARMSIETFKKSFENWEDFLVWKDPLFSSSFFRRVVG